MAVTSPRLDQLRTMLEKTPHDPFLLYAAALELKKLNALQSALDHLGQTLAHDPDYMYAYYQQGQILESQDKPDLAKAAYDAGILRARAKSDSKALGELQGARDMLD